MFLYALRQTGVVPEDVIATLKTHVSHTHIKSRDIELLGKKVGLNFLLRAPRNTLEKTELKKLGKNGIFGAKQVNNSKHLNVKPIELLFYENH